MQGAAAIGPSQDLSQMAHGDHISLKFLYLLYFFESIKYCQMPNKETSTPNPTPLENVKEINQDLFYALEELLLRIRNLLEFYDKPIPADINIPLNIPHHEKDRLERIYDAIVEENSALANERHDINRNNFLFLRDRWLIFSAKATNAASTFILSDYIDSAWRCINMATYHIAKAEMILEIELRIKGNLREKQQIKSKADSNQIIKNEKNRLVELFLQNAPEVGWKNLKLALHEIRPKLIAEFKIKKPQASQQELEQASDDLQRKLRNWMRTDPVFKSQIDRHIQNKPVPDFSQLD